MEKEIHKKLQQIEDTQQNNQRKLEESFDEIEDEKRKFLYYLDNTAELLQYTSRKRDDEQTHDISAAYRLLEQVQEDGQQITKKAVTALEDNWEENQVIYTKKVTAYEEELYLLKKEEEK